MLGVPAIPIKLTSQASFDGHVVAEDMVAEEAEAGWNVVRLDQQNSKEHLVAAEHCKHVDKGLERVRLVEQLALSQ